MSKLTAVKIRNLVNAGRPVAIADGGGLTFTLAATGTASWVLRYRFGGKSREMTLGRYPDISAKKARELATEQRAKIQRGADVARDKQKTKTETASAKSFRQLAAHYMDKVFPTLAPSTVIQRRYHIEKLLLPKLGGLPARDVSADEIVPLIEAIGKRSHSTAELVFTALSEIFKHGMARHAVKANPCVGISVTAICGKREATRQRLKLTDDELHVLLPALPAIGEQNALTVRILLATCTRIGELARAEWAHVDFERGLWFIPDANSKTGKGFTVPLVPAVADWFKALQVFACGSRYVLPARQARRTENHGGEVYFEARAVNAMLHKLCDKLNGKVRRFTPHDLRSTARSHLAALGVSVIVAERCLNHALGGLLAVYDQHDYLSERRAALEIWTDFLVACEAGKAWNAKQDNVIALKQAAA